MCCAAIAKRWSGNPLVLPTMTTIGAVDGYFARLVEGRVRCEHVEV
jgi:hypothetical protein